MVRGLIWLVPLHRSLIKRKKEGNLVQVLFIHFVVKL